MKTAECFLQKKLNERIENGLLRELSTLARPIDFCSNDYLGFAKSAVLNTLIEKELTIIHDRRNGSGGSRLLTGNHPYTLETEIKIAKYHSAEAGLIFNSGYDANLGILASVPQRGDTIICDELIHASLIDGARLSNANRFKFKHNDLSDLTLKLKNARGNVYVVVESIYSMDGDSAPLIQISKICEQYQANLIVDEAHAVGVFGEHGKGLIFQLNLQDKVFARIVTFGKSLGTHGAIVLGSANLRNYLINFARSFIYTTAAPLHQIVAINCAYSLLENSTYKNELVNKIATYNQLTKNINLNKIESSSAIQTILFSKASTAKLAAKHLQNKGFDVRAIISPTVPIGKERLRICLHVYNTDEEIANLISALKNLPNET